MTKISNTKSTLINSCAAIDARVGAIAFMAIAFEEAWVQTLLMDDAPTAKELYQQMLQGTVKYTDEQYRDAPGGTRTLLRALELGSRQLRGDAAAPAPFKRHDFSVFGGSWEYLVGGGGQRAWVTARFMRGERIVLATVSFAIDNAGKISDGKIIVEPSSEVRLRINRTDAESLVEMLSVTGIGRYTWQQMVCPTVLEIETSKEERSARQAAQLAVPAAVVMPGGKLAVF